MAATSVLINLIHRLNLVSPILSSASASLISGNFNESPFTDWLLLTAYCRTQPDTIEESAMGAATVGRKHEVTERLFKYLFVVEFAPTYRINLDGDNTVGVDASRFSLSSSTVLIIHLCERLGSIGSRYYVIPTLTLTLPKGATVPRDRILFTVCCLDGQMGRRTMIST